ncbi:hypothetical protein ACX80E_08265 [Arthrobacter sp. TMN-49]
MKQGHVVKTVTGVLTLTSERDGVGPELWILLLGVGKTGLKVHDDAMRVHVICSA